MHSDEMVTSLSMFHTKTRQCLRSQETSLSELPLSRAVQVLALTCMFQTSGHVRPVVVGAKEVNFTAEALSNNRVKPICPWFWWKQHCMTQRQQKKEKPEE